jgi:hypothetical protein
MSFETRFKMLCTHCFMVLLTAFPLFPATKGDRLCPNRIASLMTVPGNLDALILAQRVEIRQCPVDVQKARGSFQLVAWQKAAAEPSLILETEDSGFSQLVMIEGIYVIELMGGRVSRTVAIVFENGKPRVAMNEPSRLEPRIQSDRSKVLVELVGLANEKRRFEFKSGQTTTGRN